MVAFAMIEWTWGEAFLHESARDLVSVVGFAVTFVGFAITIAQLRKTRSAARAAELAANRTLEENRFAFRKFTVALAHRFIHEAKIHVENEAWKKASIRLSDLTDQLNQLTSSDSSWVELTDELHTWNVTCSRLKNNELKRFPETKKWLAFCSRLVAKLNHLLGPFAEPKEDNVISDSEFLTIVRGLHEKTSKERVAWQEIRPPLGKKLDASEGRKFQLNLPASAIELQYVSPRAEPNYITFSLLRKSDGQEVAQRQLYEGDFGWNELFDLYALVSRQLLGWDTIMKDVTNFLEQPTHPVS